MYGSTERVDEYVLKTTSIDRFRAFSIDASTFTRDCVALVYTIHSMCSTFNVAMSGLHSVPDRASRGRSKWSSYNAGSFNLHLIEYRGRLVVTRCTNKGIFAPAQLRGRELLALNDIRRFSEQSIEKNYRTEIRP